MSLSSRAIAIQGIGFGVALLVAVQGFAPITEATTDRARHGGSSSAQYLASRTLEAIELRDQEEILVILNTLASLGII